MKPRGIPQLVRIGAGVALLIAALGALPARAVAAQPASAPAMLQFTSAGHALGFTSQGVYAASGSHALHVEFVGAQPIQPRADAGVTSAKAVPLSRVTYTGLWKGIDLTYSAAPGSIYTTTYTLTPGAQVQDIRLQYNAPLTLNRDGSLNIAFPTGAMTESAPLAWQQIGGRRVSVNVSFQLRGAVLGFALGRYDPGYMLTIDPSLTWNTFLGGSGTDAAFGIAADGSGNIYVGGYSTASWGAPVRSYGSLNDAFVAKLDSSGALAWNTFLGGNGVDIGWAIAVDSGGNVYVAGSSSSTWGSPVRSYSSNDDVFVARLDSSGALTWSTFLGGSSTDDAFGIAVDGSGNVYVTGQSSATWGIPLRAIGTGYDAFAAKLDSSGGLTWNTFLGGSGMDVGRGIAVNGSGNVSVAGTSDATWGTPVQSYTSGGDAFAARLFSNGLLSWSTFLGGSGTDEGYAVLSDDGGNVYVAGDSTATWGSPVQAYISNYDGFAAELSPSGVLSWNTFMGGSNLDQAKGLARDAGGNLYVAGNSSVSWGSPLRDIAAGGDAFAAGFDSSGGRIWNTFLGGSGADTGYAVAVDGTGRVYVAGDSSATWGSPVRAYTISAFDAFVTALGPPAISGNVGVAGATLSYTDGTPKTSTADGSGNYSFTVSNDWTGTVTPTMACYSFTPVNRTYSHLLVDKSGENYTPTPITCSASFVSNGAQDGWVLESSETSSIGGTKNAGSTTFRLGDDASNRQYRSILSFDTSSLPDNAIISRVTLEIMKQGQAGTDPFKTHGHILVDIRDGTFGKVALQLTDFQKAANKKAVAAILKAPSGSLYQTDLPSTAFTLIDLTGPTQFRLRFAKDDNNDFGADYLKFYSGNAGGTNLPMLLIEYHLP